MTLQHELIQIDPGETVKRPRPAPRLKRVLPPTRLAYSGRVQRPSLGARARRVVFGDGRFRPEPFPRLEH